MENKKRILLFTPDGTGIKNYLYSKVFGNISSHITLFHNFDDDTLSQLDSTVKVDAYLTIPKYKERVKEKFLRELIHAARLNYNAKNESNPTILAFRKKKHATLKLKVFYALVSRAAKRFKDYKSILELEQKYDQALKHNPFFKEVQKLLQQVGPDLVFCTHQRALKAPTVFMAAKDLGIATTTVIYSWDNIPKARLALRADKYLVWSQYMKTELERMYPEIASEKVVITGTPQFEFYNDPENIIEPSKFYETYGLDAQKKLICFSGDDVKTSPYDPHYLYDLAHGLSKEREQYQIIFRRCPVDLSGRYDWVIKKFPDLIVEIPPLWNFNSKVWTAVYPVYEDVKLLVSLAHYCDVVLNVGSTMAFDFGMFGKPCIYINYDHVPDKNWSVDTIYRYQHFRSMPSKKAVYWLNSKEEISELMAEVIRSPKTEIEDWFKIVVNHVDTASDNIIKELV
ncbi:MAG: hypothetical protein AAF489_12285 [Bacteroidota bacterium]